MVDGALIGTTEHDIFSIDPATCHQNWRISEDYTPATSQAVNRGAAYLDGRLFRGTEDGRVLAYDFATGRRVWETSVANPKIGAGPLRTNRLERACIYRHWQAATSKVRRAGCMRSTP